MLRSRLTAARGAFFRTDKTRKLLEGSAGSLALRGVSFGLRLGVGVVLARVLGASEYGVFAYAVSWLGLLSIPATFGLDQVLLRFVAAYKQNGEWARLAGVLRFGAGLGLGSGVAGAALGVAVALLLPGLSDTMRLVMAITFALLPIVVLAQVRQASLRGLDHPVLAQAPENLVYPATLIALALAVHALATGGLTVGRAAALNAAAWATAFVVGSVFVARRLPSQVRGRAPVYDRSAWLGMVPSLVFAGVTFQVLQRSDVLLLGVLGTTRDVGLYTAASRSAELLLFMYDAVGLAGASLFAALYAAGDMVELQRFTTLATRVIFWTTLPVYLAFFAAAPLFLRVFGPEFVAGAGPMRMLLTTYFLSSLTGFVIVMLYMTGHQRDVAVVTAAVAVLAVVLNAALIPRFGAMGAAIASGTSLAVLKGILVVVLYRRVGVLSLPWRARQRAVANSMGGV